MTQEELAYRSNLHRNYISDVERGRRNISLIAIYKIAEGLNVSLDALFID
ncbi:MAG: helix-turn-helix transcriptional regulator [Bacilli bacterium]|nr:helix-turn-helix transcriptional regulator [Bacilli bacterium]